MAVSDPHFASQIVAPYEEPRFFDDMGCLQHYLDKTSLPKGAVIFVADHRTGEWITATAAVYSRVETLTAPMGSHVVAHTSRQSQTADVAAASGVHVEGDPALGGVPRGGSR